MLSGAPAANIAAPSTFAAIVATTVNVDHLSSSSAPRTGLQVNESYRDPQLRAFEQYLLRNMRQTDVTTDHEGIYLFNVNQVAYIVEGSTTNEQQTCTRSRLKKAMPSLQSLSRKCPHSGTPCNLRQ
jgi:hypothetical protein